MPVMRHRVDVLTDTGGDYSTTINGAHGAVLQVRYARDTGAPLDTGTDISIALAQSGVVIADYDNIGGSSFTRVPKQPVHDTGGAVVDGLREFFFAAPAEGISVNVNQSAAVAGVKQGTIFIWTG